MTRQRSLKRRIRARMARTGERYSTARRQVLRRLGNGARHAADQPEAQRRPGTRWRKRLLPLALIAMLLGAVAVVVIDGDGGAEAPSVEQRVSPADELPPGLRELFVREHLDLDRVRSFECGAGRLAQVDLRSTFVRLIQASTTRSGSAERARAVARDVTNICRTELRRGVITVSAKVGDTWLEVVPRAQVAGAWAQAATPRSVNG